MSNMPGLLKKAKISDVFLKIIGFKNFIKTNTLFESQNICCLPPRANKFDRGFTQLFGDFSRFEIVEHLLFPFLYLSCVPYFCKLLR